MQFLSAFFYLVDHILHFWRWFIFVDYRWIHTNLSQVLCCSWILKQPDNNNVTEILRTQKHGTATGSLELWMCSTMDKLCVTNKLQHKHKLIREEHAIGLVCKSRYGNVRLVDCYRPGFNTWSGRLIVSSEYAIILISQAGK